MYKEIDRYLLLIKLHNVWSLFINDTGFSSGQQFIKAIIHRENHSSLLNMNEEVCLIQSESKQKIIQLF